MRLKQSTGQRSFPCCHELYLWSYDSSFHLIDSNCPTQAVVNDLFVMNHRRTEFDAQIAAHNTPILFTNEMGLMWVVAPRFEADELVQHYVLGPFFVDNIPPQILEAS